MARTGQELIPQPLFATRPTGALERLRLETNLPITVMGGAGSLEHVAQLWKAQGIIGAAAGSLFVFKGKYRAVLINYPNIEEKAALLARAEWSS